ncbi:avidin-like [Heptranchias perlo]|uniref:avidin-like n=1 Tax=Heptranchias perlo TaxID=212740 RepID=UPI00355A1E1A
MQGVLQCLALTLSFGILSGSRAELVQPLTGCWTNELGSTMWINVSNSGLVHGIYTSKVSRTGQVAKGIVTGYQQNLEQPTVGFVVKWSIGSVTVWTGQYFKAKGVQKLFTMWLLRQNVSQPEDNWAATWTGMDLFHRCPKK